MIAKDWARWACAAVATIALSAASPAGAQNEQAATTPTERPNIVLILIDDAVVITGSFNFSKAAEESNAENLLIIEDRELATKYLANWLAHEKHSEPYKRAESK